MATETQKYADQMERNEARHSALEEFSRDERRPAVLLLSALVLSVLFFGIGLIVGRWTAEPERQALSSGTTGEPAAASTPQPATSQATNTLTEASPGVERRFSLLVATYDTSEKAQSLVKVLEEAGHTNVRISGPRAGDARPRYSILAGRFTQDEAREAARQMRTSKDPRLKNARVMEDRGQ
jgi:hypothetical protein